MDIRATETSYICVYVYIYCIYIFSGLKHYNNSPSLWMSLVVPVYTDILFYDFKEFKSCITIVVLSRKKSKFLTDFIY